MLSMLNHLKIKTKIAYTNYIIQQQKNYMDAYKRYIAEKNDKFDDFKAMVAHRFDDILRVCGSKEKNDKDYQTEKGIKDSDKGLKEYKSSLFNDSKNEYQKQRDNSEILNFDTANLRQRTRSGVKKTEDINLITKSIHDFSYFSSLGNESMFIEDEIPNKDVNVVGSFNS